MTEAGHDDRDGSEGRNPPPGALAAAAQGSAVADIAELILAGRTRIRGLLAVLDDAGPGGLLELHADAEEEICYPALFGCRQHVVAELHAELADHEDIREAVQQERPLDAGSAAWWRVVTAVLRTTSDHLASGEEGVLAGFRRHAQPTLGDAPGRQRIAFITARTRDHPVTRIGSNAELGRTPRQPENCGRNEWNP